jgi:hypothetical protein
VTAKLLQNRGAPGSWTCGLLVNCCVPVAETWGNVGTDGTFASFPLAKNEKVRSVPSFQAVSQHWPISLMLPTLPLLTVVI